MNKSLVFFVLLFFLSAGFVENEDLPKDDGGQQLEFLEFLSHFNKVSLPFSVGLATYEKASFSKSAIASKNELSRTNKEFNRALRKFIPAVTFGKFSRMGRPIIYPMARFYPDDQTVAIIYSSKLQFSSAMSSNYNIIYYDLKGNVLGRSKKKRTVGRNDITIGFTNQHHVQTFTILPSGKIKTIFYDTDWKEKPGSVAYNQNELLGFRKVKTVDYEFSTSKGFQEVGQTIANARP